MRLVGYLKRNLLRCMVIIETSLVSHKSYYGSTICNVVLLIICLPVPVAARSKAWSAATRLLRLWVRIPPGPWTFSVVSVLCVIR